MLRTALTGLRAHTLRFALMVLSIVLGVAFVAGSFVFTDTIEARFATLFTDVYAGVDATVRPTGGEVAIDAALLDDVLALDEVDRAVGIVGGSAQLVAPDGTPIGGQGPPTLGWSWSDVPSLNALRIDDGDGRAPAAADEVVIDVATAEGHGIGIGDDVTVATATGTGTYTAVGLASFGSEDNLAGATITVFTLEEAQRALGLDGRLSHVDVAASDGVDQQALVDALTATVTGTSDGAVEVVTGDQQTREELEAVTSGLGFLGSALLAFAGVAVFVGAFVIQNTFRITVAQRVRELALLRALGATAGQVTRLVLAEALALAVVGSGLGVVVGLGVAAVIKGGMEAVGIGVPDGPLTVEPRTIVVSLLVGIAVTLAAAVLPARRAARVSPVEAMADAGRPTGRRPLQVRAVLGAVVTALGVAAGASALVLEGDVVLPLLGLAGLLLVLGLSVLAPLLVVPVARVLSLPMRGITGRLARENTLRQPRRTAATASALMVGVALVSFVSILAESVRDSVAETIEDAFPAELAALSTNLNEGVSPHAVDALRAADLGTVSPVLSGHVTVAGLEHSATGVDPATIDEVFDARASVDLARIGDGVVVRTDLFEQFGWAVGDAVELTAVDGTTVPSEVVGTYDQHGLAGLVVAADLLSAVDDDERIDVVLVDVPTGTDVEEARGLALAAVADFPAVRVDTQADTVAQAEAEVDRLVALFSGLLVLALLIAVLGIANTLALSVVERTREIGLLRAVGMVPGQVRGMVRREAVVTASFGAVLGIGLGTVLGAGVVTAMADQGLGTFSVPVAPLLLWLTAAALAGVLASVGPARRAARLDVLGALASG
jgi:putative ABC transport system permease protein